MTDFFKFASENPWLTFFLAVLVGEVIVRCITYPAYYLAVAVRGWRSGSKEKEKKEDKDNKD